MTHVEPAGEPSYHHGGVPAVARVEPGETFTVHTLDCFGGRLSSVGQKPREVAPYPQVNPLTGPIEVAGVRAGETVAIHLVDLQLARDWGVATVSPRFGLLASSDRAPSLEEPTEERVWIWHEQGGRLVTATTDGRELNVPTRPFLGTVSTAPAHGEVFSSVRLGSFGGNLDTPLLRSGATVLLPAAVDGGLLSFGDGHLAQGDGEVAGTAIEGDLTATVRCAALTLPETPAVPRIIDDLQLTSVGWGRPLEDAVKAAVADLVRWVAATTAWSELDAYQLVTQSCEIRVANLVNPEFSVTASISRELVVPDELVVVHDRLSGAAS